MIYGTYSSDFFRRKSFVILLVVLVLYSLKVLAAGSKRLPLEGKLSAQLTDEVLNRIGHMITLTMIIMHHIIINEE